MALVGLLPFGAIFVELFYIMNNMWFGKLYYMFGFLFLCYGIMILTCAAVTVLLVYFLLCSENYHWQWRAFTAAGASAGYVFANALLYWFSQLSFGSFTSGVLYIGYSALVSFLFFILTGKCNVHYTGGVDNLLISVQGPLASSRVGHLYTGSMGQSRSIRSVPVYRTSQLAVSWGLYHIVDG